MKPSLVALLALALVASSSTDLSAQEGQAGTSFVEASADLERQLVESLAELGALRETIAAERIPLGRRLAELESELSRARLEYQQTTRLLDSRTLDLSNLRTELEARKNQAAYLSNLLGEYARNFESRLHIAELQRHRLMLDRVRLATEDTTLSQAEQQATQVQLLVAALERLEDVLGGTRFQGTAVDASGRVQLGTYALVGPLAIFRSTDGARVGTAEQRLGGSLEPALVEFGRPEDATAGGEVVMVGAGSLPVDPTLGNAHKMQDTRESFLEHVQKGGPVMIPIFVLAAAALLVALYKWIALVVLPRPSRKRVRALLAAVDQQDEETVRARVRGLRGPIGRMLAVGVAHLREPRELIEESMYETVLTTRLKLQSFLPFIAICAAAAPLLGLLGTVTGIINTFKLITVFGSGDVKVLSGGISEALITTKFGLIVAIPALLMHAFLSRKARGYVGEMEAIAVSFVNHVSKTSFAPASTNGRGEAGHQTVGAAHPAEIRSHVNEILLDLLGPLARNGEVDLSATTRSTSRA